MQRGAELAMDEINAAGGVLGRQLSLVIRDNEHKLDRGVAQTRELIEREGCVAILGSQGSFIGLAVIDTIHELKVPWFALAVGGVGIIENNRKPNYMFRVATNDREVAKFLVNYGQKGRRQKVRHPERGHRLGRAGHRRPAGGAQGDATSSRHRSTR